MLEALAKIWPTDLLKKVWLLMSKPEARHLVSASLGILKRWLDEEVKPEEALKQIVDVFEEVIFGDLAKDITNH